MIRNDTNEDFQLRIHVGEKNLEGEWRSTGQRDFRYEVIERNHEMKCEFWGGYSRHNELYREIYDLDDNFIKEEFIVANEAIMMYSPFLNESTVKKS